MNQCKTLGIDLAKNYFYLFMFNELGQPMMKKRLSRSQLLRYLAQLERCVVAMEACASSHYWGREISQLGHQVELLPPQHVKGYLRGQKNDYNDAQAIGEASIHGAIRHVPVKTLEQQDEQVFLQMRRHLNTERTRLLNHVRGLVAEYGIVLPKGCHVLRGALPKIMDDDTNGLTSDFRQLLRRQYSRLVHLDEELSWYDQELSRRAKGDETSQRLMTLPGFGPVVSQSVKAWMGDGQQFKRGRDASAALGLVPRQFSTGGREVLLGISKRGDRHLRSLVIHGARSVVSRAKNKADRLSLWINRLVAQRGFNKATVALANKLMRMAWVLVSKGETYQPSCSQA